MAILDLRTVKDEDGFVVYFGGQPNEVDTYTFANALVALSDAFQEINNQINPGYAFELHLEAVADGSFQARLRERPISLKDALKWGANIVIWPILVTWFYNHVLDPQDIKVVISTDEVIIQKGRDQIIVPRNTYNAAQRIPADGKVAASVAKAIQAVEVDPKVTSLGIYKDFKQQDDTPALLIDRNQFAVVRELIERPTENRRTIPENATLGIIKAVFAKSERKWDFAWNGVKIGATIGDPVFIADVMARRIRIGAGDAIEALLNIEQVYDEGSGVWLNVSYRVIRVINYLPGSGAQQIEMSGLDQ